ncbi:MAG TPA: YdcF family protein [Roseiarcus sp.]|nr:YdcF family protein [Roseiarcus sp.]
MLFDLSKIGWLLAAPSGILFLAAVAGAALRRRGRWLLWAALAIIATVAIVPVGGLGLARLEATFPPLRSPAHVDGILVIGGALDARAFDEWPASGFGPAVGRLYEAARLAKAYPQARLIDIGGPTPSERGLRAEADEAADVLVALGVPRSRIEIERRSRNTYENAVNAAAIANPKPGQVWVLITSAFHMPRAMGCFRVAGFAPLADPVDYRWLGSNSLGFDVVGGLDDLDVAVHEYFGLVSYRLLGRTSSLWPHP